jgi:Carboxypeptidase regulatory-like domain
MFRLARAILFIASTAVLAGVLPASAFATNGPSSASPTETDVPGSVASDQTPPATSEVVDTVTAPSPTSVNGQPAGTLSTTILQPEDVDSPYGLQVYTSTASGTAAITGAVIGSSGVVAGATVTLQPSAGGSAITVTTDANGGFAFVNIPVDSTGTPYTLTVSASGFGPYTVANDTYQPDTTYDTTVGLTSSTQTYDAFTLASQGTQNTSAAGSLSPYTSFHRPPPTLLVAMYAQNGCARAGSSYKVNRYPWRFYSLHVAASELPHSWPGVTVRANMLAQTNYAWYFKRHPPSSSYNVDNTTDYQCFQPWRSVPTRWHSWLDTVLQSSFLNSSGDTKLTQYRAGNYRCSDSNYPQNGNILSQWGSLALYQQCGYSAYKDIDNYYYVGSFGDNTTPPVPNTSYSRPSGAVKLNFPSQVNDGSGNTSDVGWTYEVDDFIITPPNGGYWNVIYKKGWQWSSRQVPTSWTRNTPNCYQYRVKAINPVGSSKYASFNGGNPICPG